MNTSPVALNTILILYSAILIINCIAYFFFWKKQNDELYKYGTIIWLTTFVNFFLQGIFSDLNVLSLLSFSTYIFASLTLARVIYYLRKEEFKYKGYFIIFAFATGISVSLSQILESYTLYSLPVAIAISIPMLKSSIETLFYRKEMSSDVKILSLVIFIQAIHFLDYPFLRPHQDMALFGFSLALGILFVISTIFPAIIIRFRLEEHNTELKSEISRRKGLEEDLIEAIEETKNAYKAKDIFLSKITHEMRTPLNIILGMNNLMSDSKLDNEQMEYSKNIDESGNNLLTKISDILSFISISTSSRLKLHSKISFSDFNSKLKNITMLLNKKKIDVEFDLVESENIINDDIDKIFQAIRCLIDNAFKFSRGKPIKIKTTILRNENKGASLKFRIQDHGCGIHPDQLKIIFEQFTQADNSYTREFEGIGLGLSLSKKIAEFFGGHIEVESRLNEGSIFSIIIPVSFVVDYEEIEHNYISQITEDNLTPLKNKNILITDSDPTTHLVITNAIENYGPTIYRANSHEEAMNLISNIQFDYIFMDVSNETQIINNIRMNKENNLTPIIAVSSQKLNQHESKAIESGADLFLSKPISINSLVSTLSQIRTLKEVKEAEKV